MKEKFKIKPRTEFSKQLKDLYLSEFSKRYPVPIRAQHMTFPLFAKGIALGVALMILMGSTAVYADQKNVGAKNVLYPLKRSFEDVRMILTSTSEKPALQAYLATRRLGEIKIVKAENPVDPQIDDLKKDLNDSLERSAKNIDAEDVSESVTKKPSRVTSRKNKAFIVVTSTIDNFSNKNDNKNDGSNEGENEDASRGSGESDVYDTVLEAEGVISSPSQSEQKSFNQGEFSGKNKSLCEAWDHVFGDDDEDAKDSISNYDLLLKKFERTCLR